MYIIKLIWRTYERFNFKGRKEYTYINNNAGLKFIVDKNQIIKAISFISI